MSAVKKVYSSTSIFVIECFSSHFKLSWKFCPLLFGTGAETPQSKAENDWRFKNKTKQKKQSTVENISFLSIFLQRPHPISSRHPHSTFTPFFHTLIVETYRKINFHYPAERPNVSPLCLIDDVQTPSHTPLLFIAPQSWSPFSAFLWQIITGDVIAIPCGE